MKTWTLMFGEDHAAFRETYVATMNQAFDELSQDEQRALVAREISDAAEGLRPAAVADAMGISVDRLYELVGTAQDALGQAGRTLWAESTDVRAQVEG